MSHSGEQERYWDEMVELKAQLEYLRLYWLESERFDKFIKGFLFVISTEGIAAWTVWDSV